MVDEDSTSLVDLKTQLTTKQKQLANLKREFSCLIRDLEKIERRVPNDWVLSPELSNVFRDVSIHNEIARIQKLVADNNLLRTQLCLLEKTRREFKDKIETKMEELFKEKLQLQIELNHVKKKLDETLASNGDLEEKLEKYRSKSREARSSLSDAITRIKSTISGHMDLDERKNSNFSLNESLLAYWELIWAWKINLDETTAER